LRKKRIDSEIIYDKIKVHWRIRLRRKMFYAKGKVPEVLLLKERIGSRGPDSYRKG
jgi:hypothetical protein